MSDTILIRDLLVRAVIGVKDDERERPQDVLVNVALHTDTRVPGASDRIEDAVDYSALTKAIIALVESSRFFLVEKLAEEIARHCLSDPRVSEAVVRVEKPGAVRYARSVGVEITRTRQSLSP